MAISSALTGNRVRKSTVKFDEPLLADAIPIRREHLTLVVLAGSNVGSVCSVDDGLTTLGRESINSVVLADPGVSSRHASIRKHADHHVLEDLGSTNGTYVNGHPITSVHRLEEGDRIQLGKQTVLAVRYQGREELEAQKRLYEAAVRDVLTGVHNRRFFDERFAAEWAFAVRHRTQLALLMLDVDHFKRVNDTYGHPAGDAVLAALGRALTASVRAEDLVARYGGEEFVVLARGIDPISALQFAERLRCILAAIDVPHGGQTLRFTASIGVSTTASECAPSSPGALLASADGMLYRAKREGRNRVCMD